MANPHFGNIGDIWKHLPLAAVLAVERPAGYWESHSGSAKYPLSSSAQRDYGIFFFLKNVHRSEGLRVSAYNRLLEDLQEMNGTVPAYPGSPLIALLLLAGHARSYVFCDTDPESLASITECAGWLSVDRAHIKCFPEDGVRTISSKLKGTTEADIADTMVFIDPFDPFAGLDGRSSPAGLFCAATAAGARAAIWYGFSTTAERNRCWDDLLKTVRRYHLDSSASMLWCGEICLRMIDDPAFEFNPGVRGCGFLTANISQEATRVCTVLGNELSRIYENATVPGGRSGAFDFSTVSIW